MFGVCVTDLANNRWLTQMRGKFGHGIFVSTENTWLAHMRGGVW